MSVSTVTSLDSTPDVRLVLTTEADGAIAARLARELLDRRLVACATLVTVRSMYHWEGDIEDEEEVQLQLKTVVARLDDLSDAIAELHSYEVPEFLVLSVEASDAYGGWVDGIVAGHDAMNVE